MDIFFPDSIKCDALGDNYIFILGNCYYIEEETLSFEDAVQNCANRFENNGKIFEPKDQVTNDEVIRTAREWIKYQNR